IPDAVKVGSTVSYLHRDQSQSIRMRTTAAGIELEEAGYYPYGVQAPALTIEKGFIGERLDDGTGLVGPNSRCLAPCSGGSSRPTRSIRRCRGWGRTGMRMR